MRRSVGIGADQCDAEVRERGVGRPDLAAGDAEVVAVTVGTRREPGEVTAGVGLAEQLAPHVVAREDPRHPAAALVGGAVRDEGRAHERQSHPAEERRRARTRELGVVVRDLRHRRAPPTVVDRPVHPHPTAGVQLPLPRTQTRRLLGRRRDLDRGRRVLGQEGTQRVPQSRTGRGDRRWGHRATTAGPPTTTPSSAACTPRARGRRTPARSPTACSPRTDPTSAVHHPRR